MISLQDIPPRYTSQLPPGTPVPEIIDLLADQLTNCVLWDPAMGAMLKDGTLVAGFVQLS
jgi:hypothetical protein